MVRALREYSTAIQSYIEAMSSSHALHRTDLAALAVVMDASRRGELVTPQHVARAVRLSPSATSALLERLEGAGHVTRSMHPHYRRSVLVEITPTALEAGRDIFGALDQATRRAMSEFSEDERELVARFLGRMVEVTTELTREGPSAS